jgi:hypothetical protein
LQHVEYFFKQTINNGEKMKLSKNLFNVLGFALIINTSAFAGTGAGSSGGGDNPSLTQGAAWYLGNAPISYCIETASDFALSNEAVKDTIQSTMKQWKDYLNKKNGQRRAPMDDTPFLNLNYSYQENCDQKTDLTFYIGVTNDKIKEATKNYHNPTAFAFKESYDAEKMRSKGFIWVSNKPKSGIHYNPGWSYHDGAPFYAIILHEMGHTLGIDHVTGTIMDEKISNYLFGPDPIFHRKKIDHYLELVINDSDDIALQGLPDVSISKSKEIFEQLIGKKPTGEVTAKFILNETDKIQVIFKDAKGNYPLQISMAENNKISVPSFGNQVFKKTWWDKKNKSLQSVSDSSMGFSTHAILTDFKGKKYIMTYEYNMIYFPAEDDLSAKNNNKNHHEKKNPDINYDESLSNVYVTMHIFDKLEKKRIFGASQYWFSFFDDNE